MFVSYVVALVELSTSEVFNGVFVLIESTLPKLKFRSLGENGDVMKNCSEEDDVKTEVTKTV